MDIIRICCLQNIGCTHKLTFHIVFNCLCWWNPVSFVYRPLYLFVFILSVNRRLDEWVKLEQLDLDSVEAVVDEKVEDKVIICLLKQQPFSSLFYFCLLIWPFCGVWEIDMISVLSIVLSLTIGGKFHWIFFSNILIRLILHEAF